MFGDSTGTDGRLILWPTQGLVGPFQRGRVSSQPALHRPVRMVGLAGAEWPRCCALPVLPVMARWSFKILGFRV